MAQAVGTTSTYDMVGLREELADIIYNVDPSETPLTTAIGRSKVVSKHPEWQNDTLANPVTTNAEVEGFEYAYTQATPTVRVGNFTQISHKTIQVTETEETVDKAGRKSEVSYQMAKHGKALRMDIEASMLSNTASVAGTDAIARLSGGLPSWLTSNVSRGATGASGGFNAGTGLTVAATNGTQRAFTKLLMDDLIQACYQNGAKPKFIMVSPYVKRVFSSFMSDANVAQQRTSVKDSQAHIVGAADVYISDFGTIDVVPNHIMGTSAALARNVFFIDPEYLSQGVLRPVQMDEPAKTGDNRKKVIKTEWTLLVKAEQAVGVVADVFGMTSTT